MSHNQWTLCSQINWVEKLRASEVLFWSFFLELGLWFLFKSKDFQFVVRLMSSWKQWICPYNKLSLRVCSVCHLSLDLPNRKWPQDGSVQGFTLRFCWWDCGPVKTSPAQENIALTNSGCFWNTIAAMLKKCKNMNRIIAHIIQGLIQLDAPLQHM